MKNGIIRKIYATKDIDSINSKIKLLGSNPKFKFDAEKFLTIRIITTIILLVLLIICNINYFLILITVIAYYNLFYYFLITKQIKDRNEKLDREALMFFEILSLTLESGKNLENSLEVACYNVDCELSSEFKRSLIEVKFGKTLVEAMEDLKARIPSEAINSIILNIMQTSIFGNNIIDVMNNQVDYLREKELLQIKSKINKIPNKISIVSVIFIVPLILLIVLGPFIISLLK